MPVASSTSTSSFEFSLRVYYEDTDAGGVVYHANYLRFFERARTEWLRALGYEQQVLRDTEQCIFVVRGVNTRFLAPARLDDTLLVRSRLVKLGRASLTFLQECQRSHQTLATAEVQVGCLNALTFRPAALPSRLNLCLVPLVEQELSSTVPTAEGELS